MACSTCTTIRRAVNSGFLRPLGLPTLPVPQAQQQPRPVAQQVNPAWPSRKS
ncbi:MAG TPA: hypothetical protein VE934_12010 [Polaromonas sp.]|uniref:hypothetical protein n=1 Tax=Polaromonas sp. TaxID=1869339 RepID=UPI002D6EF552|nr:hypothetical protein [Polaromonas sp.]HYW57680.1 hypothetical protein [Polaromonas sp.]